MRTIRLSPRRCKWTADFGIYQDVVHDAFCANDNTFGYVIVIFVETVTNLWLILVILTQNFSGFPAPGRREALSWKVLPVEMRDWPVPGPGGAGHGNMEVPGERAAEGGGPYGFVYR